MCAVIGLLHTSAPSAAAAPITYEYTGQFFNFCGFGCPEHAPSDPVGADYLKVSLTFDNPLAPNLTFADDVLSLLTGWTFTDAFGSFEATSTNGSTLLDLQLGTDAGGNIVQWLMGVHSATTEAFILNPPFECPIGECDDNVVFYISDFAAVGLFGPEENEWDSGVATDQEEGLPGRWRQAQVPEPATLFLFSAGAAGVLLRRKRR
jgi:hypothetical protein